MYKYKMIMKKILLGLVMLLTTATMSAQIELEHVFEGRIMLNEDMELDRNMWLKNSTYAIDNTNGVDIYNGDFSYRTTLEGVDAYTLLAENIFTTDGAICYVTINGDGSNLLIIHENSTVISTIPVTEERMLYFLRKIGNQYKFIVLGQKCTYIYSCPGNGEAATSVENVPAKVKRNAYPNPATDLVILPYDANGATSMKIYDMQGKLVERKFLDKNKQELQLNVKDYPSGMYFFEVNGESNSFIVE